MRPFLLSRYVSRVTSLTSTPASTSTSVPASAGSHLRRTKFTPTSTLAVPLRRHASTRTSTSTPPKEWLVHVPDHSDALERRLQVRPTHLENIKPHVESKKVPFGGATLTKHPEGGETPDMTGSVVIVVADSKDEVLAFLARDPYVTSGVWDLKKATVWPFRTTIRSAL